MATLFGRLNAFDDKTDIWEHYAEGGQTAGSF